MKKGFWKPSEWLCLGTWKILKEHLDTQTGSALGHLKGTPRALKELLDFQPLEAIQGHLGTWLHKALRCSCVRNVHGHLNTWYTWSNLFIRLAKYGLYGDVWYHETASGASYLFRKIHVLLWAHAIPFTRLDRASNFWIVYNM